MGVQFLPPVAANGDQRQWSRVAGQEPLPGDRQDFIGEIRATPNQLGGGRSGPEALDQLGLVRLDAVAENEGQVGLVVPALFQPVS